MVNTNLIAKTHDVVFHIGNSAALRPTNGCTTQPTADHLAVQDHRIGRTSNEHFVGVGRIESGCQDTVVAQDLKLTVSERLDHVLTTVFGRRTIDVGRFDAKIGEQGRDEPRVLNVAGKEENATTFPTRKEQFLHDFHVADVAAGDGVQEALGEVERFLKRALL